MSDEGYTFDWQKLNEFDDYDKFLHWAVVHLVVDTDADGKAHSRSSEEFEQLREATKNFTEVTLTVQVSGVEVNPEHLMRAVEHKMRVHAHEAARETLEELAAFTDVRATVAVLQEAVVRRIEQVARALGVDMDAARLREDAL